LADIAFMIAWKNQFFNAPNYGRDFRLEQQTGKKIVKRTNFPEFVETIVDFRN
jgi:hypothetical protein